MWGGSPGRGLGADGGGKRRGSGALGHPGPQPPVSPQPPPAKYGGRHTVTLIPGDGIGPELMLHVKEVFRWVLPPFPSPPHWRRRVSWPPLPPGTPVCPWTSRRGVWARRRLRPTFTTPSWPSAATGSLTWVLWWGRTSLDLYANVIHCQSLPGVETRHRDIDILIVRENTEGEYSSLEHESVAGVVESLKIITAGRSRRIAHYAFRLARAAKRRSVTAVHKANIMYLGDGLFLQCCKEVAAEYPEISFQSMIVDNTTMQLVSRPQQFDVMVMPNLYGNIVNNVCAGLVGGPGLVPGANYGHDYAVFETVGHGGRKSIANRNIANPTAALLAACMMLDHLRLHSYATTIRQAVLASLDDPRVTPLGGGRSVREWQEPPPLREGPKATSPWVQMLAEPFPGHPQGPAPL
uniref:Isocitrate dehydrogenase (NAD(+)) 3 non-catalytic subunit gamma n=1 Tax=Amazona collaria TaxID=241587 RepID=A0A8B9FQA6_9PSIT